MDTAKFAGQRSAYSEISAFSEFRSFEVSERHATEMNQDPSVALYTTLAKDYRAGPKDFVPGFSDIHRMVIQLLDEKLKHDQSPRVLVLGAGGGLELKAMADDREAWTFLAIDPSEPMLESAKSFVGASIAGSRVKWITGYIRDASAEVHDRCDAGTCLMTLHMIPDNASDEGKLETLKQIRKRLAPNAPFVVLDNCMDPKDSNYLVLLNRYIQFAVGSGVPEDIVRKFADTLDKHARDRNITVSPEREEELFRLAGFTNCSLFYAGLTWRGWVMNS
ncbi:hypothetical protein HK100_002581 [Physocladia obscura]|uniref:Methyltransferase domain-containing protein n=1 Tax=Physocladia obscura TaxID=109957 RepID=A0AAD5TD23_9FUNG|nr:hypothetical protein HK100_002581 [Physocladia obscura]